MGLDDLVPDDSEQSKGGRPKEDRSEPQKVEGDPYIPAKDTEEYWQNIWDKFVGLDGPTDESIANMADYAHVFPWDIRWKLEEHGVYEWEDWDQFEDYPSKFRDDEEDEQDVQLGGGLGDLINDAKE